MSNNDKKKRKEKNVGSTERVEKTIEKQITGTKRRMYYVSNDSTDVMVESSIDGDSPEQLINYALILLEEGKKSKGAPSYVT